MNEPKTTLESFENEVLKMPKIKSTMTSFDYGAIYAKSFAESLRNGTSPFLPNDQGVVDIKGAYNMRTNKLHHSTTQLILRERQTQLGAPTGAFVSIDIIKKAQESGIDCAVKKGEHGCDIQVKTDNDVLTFKWFNECQLTNPENLRAYLNAEMEKNQKQTQEWLDKNHPGQQKRNAAERNMDAPNNKVIGCSAYTPEEYLAQVFTCMSLGAKLQVSDIQKEMFVTKTIEKLEAEREPGKKDRLAIFKLSAAASDMCKVYVNKLRNKPVLEKSKTPSNKRSHDNDIGIGR